MTQPTLGMATNKHVIVCQSVICVIIRAKKLTYPWNQTDSCCQEEFLADNV